nr:MAG TPA: hypothetical protein [Caudoviricetes sp.]
MAVKAQKSSLFRYFHTGEGFFFCIKDSVLIEIKTRYLIQRYAA